MRSAILAGCLLLLGACGGSGVPARPPVPPAVVPALDLPRIQPAPDGTGETEAVSLFGEPLAPPVLSPGTRADREAKLAAARAEARARPDDVEAMIWLGRRAAYLGRYREAIEVYTRALAAHPDEPRLLRHRGHRYLSIRRFDLAVQDLERAAQLVAGQPDEVEPDGLPNARNIPVSTLQTNIWYHLGLAHYFLGGASGMAGARKAFEECLRLSTNADMRVSATHWLYMTLRRQGRAGEAEALLEPIRPDMDVIENRAYHLLTLMYKGDIPPDAIPGLDNGGADAPTLGYGLGDWYLYNGRRDEAVKAFREILTWKDQWSSFGYIAAEADLKRLGEPITP
ncbi:MAG: tetratricopeptide repeat protein [Acidobacteriota bacterium]